MQDSSTSTSTSTGPPCPDDYLAGTEPITVCAIDIIIASVTFAASLGVLGLALGGGMAMRWALLLHFGVVCIPAGWFALRQRRGGELTIPALLFVATLAGGPMGAAAAACAAIVLWRRSPRPQRLRNWYGYIMGVIESSPSERLYRESTAGRAPVDPMAPVPAFMRILNGTSIDDQKRVLGVIGRRFHADFRPILRSALRNPDGFVRAQAAAIASRLNLKEKSLLWSQDATLDSAALDLALSDGGRESRRRPQDGG